MNKTFDSLGLMSGTSMDGIDLSIISSDGNSGFKAIYNKYISYNEEFKKKMSNLRDKINNTNDLEKFKKELKFLEKDITIFHSEEIYKVLKEKNYNVDLIGFHGQTIFHNADKKISKQLGDGKLLSQLLKKKVVYNFRENDLKNGGQGAPLAPIFHQLISKQMKFDLPICILNIGGIANITVIEKDLASLASQDIGPGNCLIDEWIRKNTKKNYDEGGLVSKSGKSNIAILNQALENYEVLENKNILSYDTKDFDINFIRGLSLEDGAATVTEFTGTVLAEGIQRFLSKVNSESKIILVSGGGRKNVQLLNILKKKLSDTLIIENIDKYGVDGDFIESQAFAYLAIRSFLKLPISFPKTTGCKTPTTGGNLVKNF